MRGDASKAFHQTWNKKLDPTRASSQIGSAREDAPTIQGGRPDDARASAIHRARMGKAKTWANLTFNAVHGAARQALRRWNVGFPRLGRKVVVGRVARKDENDFFHVSTGHKRRVG
jgi:hypothetical protein